nr:GNAT family N-acetyltransferase [Prochlorococcus marinus]
MREVYFDAIYSQGLSLYTKEQIKAWASLAWLPGVLDRPLKEGIGWLVCAENKVEAFAIRYPSNRLALLYCRGRSTRKGYATNLLFRVEMDAYNEGIKKIFTEASLFSYPLFLKSGWKKKYSEKILIAGVVFDRYRMEKSLNY